jgi:hypothetical protein
MVTTHGVTPMHSYVNRRTTGMAALPILTAFIAVAYGRTAHTTVGSSDASSEVAARASIAQYEGHLSVFPVMQALAKRPPSGTPVICCVVPRVWAQIGQLRVDLQRRST